MDSVSVESSIRRYLGKASELELAYLIAKGEEIALGINPRKPFLKSRGIERHLKIQISAAFKVQSRYNRSVPAERMIYLVEGIIKEGDVFVRSKMLLEQIHRHSVVIKDGLRRKDIAPYEGGPSALATTAFARSPEMQKLIALAKSPPKNPIQEQQKNALNILMGNPLVSEDRMDDIDDFFKEEESKENEV